MQRNLPGQRNLFRVRFGVLSGGGSGWRSRKGASRCVSLGVAEQGGHSRVLDRVVRFDSSEVRLDGDAEHAESR